MRLFALIAALGGLGLGAAAIAWSDGAAANVLAEGAGMLLSVAVALLLVEVLAKRERRARYAELTWVAAETALDVIEDAAGRLHFASTLVGSEASFNLYFRAGDPGDEPAEDKEAQFWRSRTPDEAEWHISRMHEIEATSADHAESGVSPSPTALRTFETTAVTLERLERAGDRLVLPAADADEALEFMRWLWRCGDQRHTLSDALGVYHDDHHAQQLWDVLKGVVYVLRRTYEAGTPVARRAARATGRTMPARDHGRRIGGR